MGKETDRWPLVQAKFFGRVAPDKPRRVRLVVIHDMEYPEKLTAAEDVAKYFQSMPDGRKASAHVCVDADSVVQCVRDSDVAYAAPGANADGIHIELAGFGRQTREQWLDDYSRRVLDRAADVAAQYCIKYDLPVTHLTDDALKAGDKGIIGHVQASRVYKLSDHEDPGPNFPWDVFMPMVSDHYFARVSPLA